MDGKKLMFNADEAEEYFTIMQQERISAMSTFDEIMEHVLASAVRAYRIAQIKRAVCWRTGLSEDEVEVEIDQNGIIHVTSRPKVENVDISFALQVDGEEKGGESE